MRAQTPPLLKWLLVERATLAGSVARAQEQNANVTRELQQVQERIALLMLEAERLQVFQQQFPQILEEKLARIDALSTSILLASNDRVSPTAAGTVRAFAGRYGQRGDLKAFIVSALQTAAPGAMLTSTIVVKAISHFELNFSTTIELRAFKKNTVAPQLTRLKAQGLVEALHPKNRGTAEGRWRWKADYPTLAELTRQVRGAEPLADASRRQDV